MPYSSSSICSIWSSENAAEEISASLASSSFPGPLYLSPPTLLFKPYPSPSSFSHNWRTPPSAIPLSLIVLTPPSTLQWPTLLSSSLAPYLYCYSPGFITILIMEAESVNSAMPTSSTESFLEKLTTSQADSAVPSSRIHSGAAIMLKPEPTSSESQYSP